MPPDHKSDLNWPKTPPPKNITFCFGGGPSSCYIMNQLFLRYMALSKKLWAHKMPPPHSPKWSKWPKKWKITQKLHFFVCWMTIHKPPWISFNDLRKVFKTQDWNSALFLLDDNKPPWISFNNLRKKSGLKTESMGLASSCFFLPEISRYMGSNLLVQMI